MLQNSTIAVYRTQPGYALGRRFGLDILVPPPRRLISCKQPNDKVLLVTEAEKPRDRADLLKRKAIDLYLAGKSKRLAKQNREYLDLFSVVQKSRFGFAAEQTRFKSKPARTVAKQLQRQLELISEMVSLPYVTMMTMEGYADGVKDTLIEAMKSVRKPGEEIRASTADERDKRAKEHAAKTMERFFAIVDTSGSMSRPWLLAITVYIWTAFECLSGDLWETSLNSASKLGHRALSSLPTEDNDGSGLSRKHIEVGLAARHGFDLRRSLGSILKPKFDFGSLSGIQSAYKQAFGSSGELEKFGTLRQLEQVRHLIVHRGGIADDKFIKLTGHKTKVGRPLSLTLSQVAEYMMSVTLGCVSLLKVADEYFVPRHESALPPESSNRK